MFSAVSAAIKACCAVRIGAARPSAVIAAKILFSWVTNAVSKLLILVLIATAAVDAVFAAVIAFPTWVLRVAIWAFVAASALAFVVTCVCRAATWALRLARATVWSENKNKI